MKVAANDVELFCRIEGEGDPALVMHGGLGADHTVFVNSPFNKLANGEFFAEPGVGPVRRH